VALEILQRLNRTFQPLRSTSFVIVLKGGERLGMRHKVAGNATGGQRQQVAYTDQWVVGTTFDLTRLGVVPGGTIQVTWTDRNGSNLSDDAGLGTLQQVQEVFGRGQTLRLTDFWYARNSQAARSTGRSGGCLSARISHRSRAISRT
jgi:Carbohydrate-selective porin, OprB family